MLSRSLTRINVVISCPAYYYELGFVENPKEGTLLTKTVSKSTGFTYSTDREMVLKLPHMVWA